MQPTENFNISRRSLDVEDYIDILRRHKSWVFGPFLLTLVASVVGVYFWPDRYESSAIIKIVPQQVPQNMVQSSVSQDMVDRIQSMAATVLSRSVLTTIINNYDLYPSQRKRLPTDDVVEMMHGELHIDPMMVPGGSGRNVPAFTVRFAYENRLLASKVVSEVVNRFISENVSSRSNATSQSYQFFKDAADGAKKELDALEEQVSQFRLQNNGRLPEQMEMNSRQLTNLQNTLQNLNSGRTRAESEKLYYETNLRVEKAHKAELTRETPPTAAAVAAMKSERLQAADRDIQRLEDGLTLLLQKRTEAHPDVQSVRGQLETAKNRRQTILKEEAENKTSAPAAAPNRQLALQVVDVQGNIERLESAINQKVVEMADLDSRIKQTQTAINRMDAQINSAPLGEQRYADLLRERDQASKKYLDLAARLNTADLSQDLENRGQGEKLEVLDAANVPLYPSEPKRPQIIAMGAGLGLLLGVVIAAAREMKDTSLKNLKDVRAYTQMAILGSVPLLENDFVVRRRKRMAWLGWTTACLVAVITMAGSIVYYYYRNNA